MRPNRGIPDRIGKAVKRGILVTTNSYAFVSDGEGCPTYEKRIFDICRTAYGGKVKTREFSSNEYRMQARYMIIPDEFAQLIVQFEKLQHYAGLSLQGFLMKAWRP